MRPITFICALAATLQLLSGSALAGSWTWPVRGPVITSYRNGDDPYAGGQHRGVDIGAPVGARVVAAAGGRVTFAGVVGSSGLVVSERTTDGRFDLSYLHLSSLTVRAGQTLAEGGAVGAVGTTGRRSTQAPHLHFGVREAGRRNAYRDPLDFLAPPAAAQRPGPVPVPVPVGTGQPAAADPAPAPGSAAPSPAPVPALGSPYLVPSQARAAPHPHAAHGLVPRPLAPTAAPHSAGRTDRHVAPAHGGTTARARHMAPPGIGPHSATETAESAAPHYAPATPGATHSHGINLGWLAACIGLIALATALGHPDGTRQAAARSRAAAGRRRAALARAGTRLGALLRPASRGGPAR